ncbi:oligosaccharide flippase family protein [Cognatishimia maritima]|uniref:Membrane protein involved in the export of O-antigen and teichoic acid n=1 Tax=Cognatishimia maritima TaxID=870908 RepID=A0A1M5N8G5_9RHOB|nr:oligosaccharide flippase family protein [Cognatishimia maritima]SHG85788.1 Membrane protein involved in the export of O-antigen and teichoic acid [Cognatishimia maritima]
MPPRPTHSGPLRTGIVALASQGTQQMSGLVLMLLAISVMPLADYGAYALAIVSVEFVVMLTHTGFHHFLVTSDADDTPLFSTLFWTILGLGTLGGLGLWMMAQPMSEVFAAPLLELLLLGFALLQPAAAMVAWATACHSRLGHMQTLCQRQLAINLISLTAGCIALLIWPSVFALLIFRAIKVLLGVWLLFWCGPLQPKAQFSRQILSNAACYARGLYGTRLLEYLSNFGTDLILAYLFSTTESGIYRIAHRLAFACIELITHPLRLFALQTLARAQRLGHPIAQIFANYLAALLLLSGGIVVLFVLSGGAILTMASNSDFLTAFAVSQVLIFRAAFLGINSLLEPALATLNDNMAALRHNLIWTGLFLVVTVLAAPLGVALLAALQTGLAGLTALAAMFVLSRRINLNTAVAQVIRSFAVLALYCGGVTLIWQVFPSTGTVLETGLKLAATGVIAAVSLAFARRLGCLSPDIFASQPISGASPLPAQQR